ncbi:MAG TPA: RNA pseudouridine synthase [Sphingobium sp.]|uniref:RluA family pseudouridine synthase n=1 Tax=Sphingobium sp. TaxID=1912891 RepID=UPI002ED0AA21
MPINHNRHRVQPDAFSPLVERVIFIDGEAIVLDKPAGLPVDAPRDGSLSLENHLASLTFGFQRWPLAVHRLDRDTSGCLLLARNPKAHKRFTAAFEAKAVEKEYLAVLTGVPTESEGMIDIPLGKTSTAEEGWRMVPDAKRGKVAQTRWRLIAERDGKALVLFAPLTGRTHQIRVHALEGLGHGIVGDPVYGERQGMAGEPLLLHALSLKVGRGEKPAIEARAPVPERFALGGFGDAEALLDPAQD